jgi:hypothetical protein
MNGLSWEDDGAREGLLTKRSSQNCLTDHELEEYLFSRLSGVTREVIEEHLLVCEHCQDRVEAEEAYVGAFQQAAKQLDAEDFARAMSGAAVVKQPGWRESVAAAWTFLSGRRTLLAAAGVAMVAGVLYSPLMRRPTAEAAVDLSLTRGAGDAGASAPAGNLLKLSADVTELPALAQWQVDVVSATGQLEQSASVVAESGRLNWQVKSGLAAGRHWVRLRDPRDGSLVREYGLVVR